ncbi:MAG: restriction endonuclease subunit S [Nitrosomonas sp.]|nr:restriction endonuclease subunit S [Nitrosomonas sp.]
MSWSEKKISELGEIVTGKTPSTKVPEFFGGEYPFVTPSDIEYGHYYARNTETTVTELAKSKHRNQFVPKDSVLFTCIGNTMGKCAIAAQECLTNQQINAVVANDDNDPKFLYYLLHHSQNIVRGIGMGGGAATPIINKTTFGNVRLQLPTDKTTQEAISSILSQYDDLIENNKRRIELLEESARQLYKEWFVRFRFPGHEHVKIIDGVPEGWITGSVREALNN